MVLALAGDSTITRFFATLTFLFFLVTIGSNLAQRKKLARMLCHDSPQLKLQKQFKHRRRRQSGPIDDRIDMELISTT
jgi:hypothetical protein